MYQNTKDSPAPNLRMPSLATAFQTPNPWSVWGETMKQQSLMNEYDM
jgi:hypothetical protein